VTHHDLLVEQYEDALFALLMENVTQWIGEEALAENRNYKNTPAGSIPHDINQRCIKLISSYFSRQAAHKTALTAKKIFTKAAVAALIAILLFTTAIATSDKIRSMTYNFLIETFEDHTVVRMDPVTQDDTRDLVANWLPDGWMLESQEFDSRSIYNTYLTSVGDYVYASYYILNSSGINLDTEDAVIEEIPINGVSAMLIEKGGYTQITWGESDLGAIVLVEGSTEYREELIKFAENLKCY